MDMDTQFELRKCSIDLGMLDVPLSSYMDMDKYLLHAQVSVHAACPS
jgi:hypothetical protein